MDLGLLCSASRGDTMLYLPTARLWHVALDGTMRMMTMGEVWYWNPDIARSGSVVAASVRLESDIWSFPTDGSPRDNVQNAIRITNQNSHVVTPTAGPGGREVAFVSDRGGHSNIWVIDVASRKLRQITDERDPNVAIGVPVWSPTGAAIVFVSTRGAVRAGTEGQPEVRDAPSGPLGLWLVNPDGSNLRFLVQSRSVALLGPRWPIRLLQPHGVQGAHENRRQWWNATDSPHGSAPKPHRIARADVVHVPRADAPGRPARPGDTRGESGGWADTPSRGSVARRGCRRRSSSRHCRPTANGSRRHSPTGSARTSGRCRHRRASGVRSPTSADGRRSSFAGSRGPRTAARCLRPCPRATPTSSCWTGS